MSLRQFVCTAALAAACTAPAFAQDAKPAQTVQVVVVKPAAVRPFAPDYSRALTPAQMTAAWQAEAERFVPAIPSTP